MDEERGRSKQILGNFEKKKKKKERKRKKKKRKEKKKCSVSF